MVAPPLPPLKNQQVRPQHPWPDGDHPPSIPRKALGPLPTVSCSGDASGLQQRSRWATRWCPRVPSGSSPACWPRPLSHLLLTFIPRVLLRVSSGASPPTPTGALGRSRTHGDALLLRRVWLLWRRTHGSWDSPGSHPSLPVSLAPSPSWVAALPTSVSLPQGTCHVCQALFPWAHSAVRYPSLAQSTHTFGEGTCGGCHATKPWTVLGCPRGCLPLTGPHGEPREPGSQYAPDLGLVSSRVWSLSEGPSD